MRQLKSLLVALTALALLGAQAARAEQPVTIRVGWVVPVSSIVSIMLAKPDLLKNEGKTYKLDLIHFRGTPDQINALATGALDIGGIGFTSLPLAIENAHLGDLRVIVDEMQFGVQGYADLEFRVRQDSKITKVSDLKGKVLVTNVLGSAADIPMNIELRQNGLNPKTDVNVIEAAFPTMKSLLLSGKADLVPAVLPFAEEPEFKAKSRVLFTQREPMGGPSDQVTLVARKSFIDQHRAAVEDFLADYLRMLHFYLDPAHHDVAVGVAAKFAKLPPRVFQSWLFTHKDYYLPPDGVPSVAILQHNIDVLYKYGYLKQKLDMAKYVDASLIKAAAAKLK
jgi:NitT/TauT family transport system substrate-binding protein